MGTTLGVDRLTGRDRYEVAVNISRAAFPDKASVVYIANGSIYADGLSAAPAAVKEGSPVLLTTRSKLFPSVKAEIQRLKPARIMVVGGPNAINPTVFAQLKKLAKVVVRLDGANRYITSRAVVDHAFDSASVAFVVTGKSFPDALAASQGRLFVSIWPRETTSLTGSPELHLPARSRHRCFW